MKFSKIIFYELISTYFLIIYYKIRKLRLNNRFYDDIYYFNNKIKSMNAIFKLKKVVYSVILGKYDEIKTINIQNGYDYFIFSDVYNKTSVKTNWTILPIPEEVKNLNITDVKKQRFIKLHPHLYFKNYDLSIYIDATFTITGDLDEFLLRTLSSKYYIYSFEHPLRSNITEETYAVVRAYKEKDSISKIIRERYMRQNFPDSSGLIESCLIIRNHNDKNCVNLMNDWFEEIKTYSHRDQLSFNFIIWKNKYRIKYII
jgi:hypothetical protein